VNISDAQKLAHELMDEHGLTGWSLKLGNATKLFGRCVLSDKEIVLSRRLVEANDEAQVRDVILHEIAHALIPDRHGHDEVWKTKCIEIGARPEQYHSANLTTLTTEDASALVENIQEAFSSAWDNYAEGCRLLIIAKREKAWLTLGLSDWTGFVAHAFNTDRVRIPKRERNAIVTALVTGGLSIREVAAATGLGIGTVHRELSPGVPSGTPKPGDDGGREVHDQAFMAAQRFVGRLSPKGAEAVPWGALDERSRGQFIGELTKNRDKITDLIRQLSTESLTNPGDEL
jgi:SprT-like family